MAILVGWNSPYGAKSFGVNRSYIACVPLVHAMIYSLAVLGTYWLRRPVLVGMAVVLLFLFVSVVLQSEGAGEATLEPLGVYEKLDRDERLPTNTDPVASGVLMEPGFDLRRHQYPLVYGVIGGLIVLSSLAAWRVVIRPSRLGRRVQG